MHTTNGPGVGSRRFDARRAFGLTGTAAAMPLLVFLAVYVPTAGHGFIKDDFRWIAESRVRDLSDVRRVAHSDNGFYRPAVAFTFAANELVFGTAAKPYGLTNVALALAAALGVLWLARSLGAAWAEAWLAGTIWLLGFHGINMAILWVSGRTALLLVIFGTTCAALLHNGRLLPATAALAAAMFSKEEAILLPGILFLGLLLQQRAGHEPRVPPRRWLVFSTMALLAYLLARATTDAMTPGTAPPVYRFTFDLSHLLRNVAEYADRALTWPVIVSGLGLLILRPARGWYNEHARLAVSFGALWVAGTYALTVFLPVRSSLYACFPAAGACVAAAAVCGSAWDRAPAHRRRAALLAAAILPLALFPLYYARTQRWVELADFTSQALLDMSPHVRPLTNGAIVEIADDLGDRVNVASAFGSQLPEAVALVHGRHLTFRVDSAEPDSDGTARPCAECVDLRLAVANGRLVPR